MGLEIERKFLINAETWRDDVVKRVHVRQGYLANTERCSVRAREADERGFLNLKSMTLGMNRDEYEYEIPVDEARTILDTLCTGPLIEKVRHYVPYAGHTWEIDVFEGSNAGLVLAEVELASPDEAFVRPPWLGREVTDDIRYYNVTLVEHPYSEWQTG